MRYLCALFCAGLGSDDCGHDYFVACSYRAVESARPSCSTRRMAETATHLTDHVFPHLAVRQRMMSVPKRLHYFMQRDGAVPSIKQSLASGLDAAALAQQQANNGD